MGTVQSLKRESFFAATAPKTTNANNTTTSIPLFRVTGAVMFLRLYGAVTTTLGANHTAAHWRLEDGTNTPPISLASGTTLSAFQAGSELNKDADESGALRAVRSDQTRQVSGDNSNGSANAFLVVQKAATNTNVVYRYSTTDAPTTGAIQFFCEWFPLSAGGNVTPL